MTSAILQKATGGWLGSEEQNKIWQAGMFLPDGGKLPAWGLELLDDVERVPGTSQWIIWNRRSDRLDCIRRRKHQIRSDHRQTAELRGRPGAQSAERLLIADEETLSGISSAVAAGDKYSFDLWTRDNYVVTNMEAVNNLDIDESNPTTAQGGLVNFADNAWLHAGHYLHRSKGPAGF